MVLNFFLFCKKNYKFKKRYILIFYVKNNIISLSHETYKQNLSNTMVRFPFYCFNYLKTFFELVYILFCKIINIYYMLC